jgi:hypothetical protein
MFQKSQIVLRNRHKKRVFEFRFQDADDVQLKTEERILEK